MAGVLGPILRAEVGDTLLVHYCNRADSGDYSIHPHGVRYDKDNEGAFYAGVNSGQLAGAEGQVAPGQCFDYRWTVDRESGPTWGD